MRRLILTVVLVTLGCNAKPDHAAEAAAAATFIQSLAQILCNYNECAAQLSPAGVQQACTPLPQASLDESSNVSKAVLAGNTTFNSTQAQGCLDALAPYNILHCWGPTAPAVLGASVYDQACGAVFTGSVAPGGACYDSSECANGYCNANLDQCPGRCDIRRSSDTGCQTEAECDPGLVCYQSPNGTGFCVAPVATGGSCLGAPCEDGLLCNAGLCATPALGMTCGASGCGTQFTCHFQNPGSTTGTCAALAPAGGPCNQDADCAGNQLCIQSNLGNGTCGSPSDVGAPCQSNGPAPAAVCFRDLICDPLAGKCAALPAAGMPCLADRCAPTAYCDLTGTTATCTALKAAGAACMNNSECKTSCTGGVCLASVQVDQDCVAP